ncbi:MAG: AAA family ATPase [Acidobacteriota bacterium]|nr:AAA family ATPase [Acidobacteriota bacterium]
MNGANRQHRLIRFSDFELDLNSGELFKQGRKVKLQSQPFDLLAALLERPGELVGREELRQKIWPSDTVVDFAHGLNRAINKAREALGDSAENPHFIETLPRRGYRFIGSIQQENGRAPAPDVVASDAGILIGREAEREQLINLLNAAVGGHGSLVLIGGEPGIGKTHLTRAVLAEGAQRGCFGVVGHSYELEGTPPYAPFVEMLEHCARVEPRESFRCAIGESGPQIAKLMPDLQRIFPETLPAAELPPEQQRRFLFNAYSQFMERSAGLKPIVAVFEDLHWADEPTLLLLKHLARIVSGIPVLLIGTYRDVEVDVTGPFTRCLESWVRERVATRFTLRGLGLTGVSAMLAALSGKTPPNSLASTIFDKTEGNPFFVEEVFRHLSEEGKLFDAAGEWRTGLKSDGLQVPEGVRLVIGRRLEKLREETRRILTVAAVIGRSFDMCLLETLEGEESEAVFDALEEAERAHLAAPVSEGREIRYRFAHELVRQTLAEALSMPRRQRLHRRIADAIEEIHGANLDSQASALAHHLYQAGAAADLDRTVTYLAMAARQASTGAAYEEALDKVDKALSLIEAKQHQLKSELHLSRAVALRSLSRTVEAVQAYECAITSFVKDGNLAGAAEASFHLAYIHLWTADGGRASAVVDRAIQLIGIQPTPLLHRLFLLKSASLAVRGEMGRSLAALSDAKEMSRALPEAPADGFCSMCEARILFQSARLQESDRCSREALERFRAMGNLWGEAEAFESVAAALWLGRIRAVEVLLPDSLACAERAGHLNAVWAYKAFFGHLRMALGDLAEAARSTQSAHDFATGVAGGWSYLDYLMLGIIAHYRGKLDEAERWFRQGLNVEPVSYLSGQFSGALFWTLAARGEAESSAALTKARFHLPVPRRPLSLGTCGCLAFLLEGLAILGRFEEAAALEAHAEYVVANGPLCVYSQHLFRTSAGIACAAATHWTRAEEHHQAAIHQADSSPYRVAQPGTRFWYAEMLLARNLPGDRERASGLLREALHLSVSMTMRWQAERTAKRISELGMSL